MVPHRVWAAAFAAIGIGLAGCGGGPPKGAVQAAQRLVEAAQADDRIAFEVELDREAVREDLRAQVATMARDSALDVDGGPSEFALDRMIAPAAVRLLKVAGTDFSQKMTMTAGKACVPDAGPGSKGGCLLTFAKEMGGCKLVGLRATDLDAMSGLNDPGAAAPADDSEDR
jgi:hypothetical protein